MDPAARPAQEAPPWRTLNSIDRRVFGVLIEKAKTTPDAYPMTANGLRSGANQKSNREPVMELTDEQISDSLERLRQFRAVAEVQGSGRVPKYRHYAYEWLGVNKVELAVMAELLLRGEQTEGELRGRAARMEESITDLNALRPILNDLKAKGLVIPLTPEGRGHMVTHGLLEPRELERVKSRSAAAAALSESAEPAATPASAPARSVAGAGSTSDEHDRHASAATSTAAPAAPLTLVLELAAEVTRLQGELAGAKQELSRLADAVTESRSEVQIALEEIRQLKSALGG